MTLNLILFIYFLFASSFFSGVEASFLSLDRVLINRFEHSKNIIHIIITYFIKRFDLLIISLLFFNLLNNIFAISMGRLLLQDKFQIEFNTWSVEFFYTIALTFLLLLFCEITPKRIGIKYSKNIALLSVPFMVPIFFIFFPISWIYKYFTKKIMSLFDKNKNYKNNIDKSEFISFIKKSSAAGAIKEIESLILQHLINYKDIPIKSVLIPRLNMAGFNINDLPDNLPKAIIKFPYNTIPVYESVKDNVIGVLSKKKLFYNALINDLNKKNLKKALDIPEIFHENKSIMETLIQMQKNKTELCLITDEYGGIEGIATYVDIVRKLLGKIEVNENELEGIKRITPNYYRVNPLITLDEFNVFFKTDIICESAETVGGYLTEINHNIPSTGQIIKSSTLIFTIKQSNKKRIQKLMVRTN